MVVFLHSFVTVESTNIQQGLKYLLVFFYLTGYSTVSVNTQQEQNNLHSPAKLHAFLHPDLSKTNFFHPKD
jgi:hypothetical protein